MFFLTSVKAKIGVLAGLCLILTAAILIYAAAEDLRAKGIEAATLQVKIRARELAARARVELEKALHTARTLAETLSGTNDSEVMLDIGRDEIDATLQIILRRHSRITSIFTCWEPMRLDGLDDVYANQPGSDASGRYMPVWFRDGSQGADVALLAERYPVFMERDYPVLARTHTDLLTEPRRPPGAERHDWIACVVVPIVTGEKFHGVVGIELSLDFLGDLARGSNGAGARIAFFSGEGNAVATSVDFDRARGGSGLEPIDAMDVSAVQGGKETSRLAADRFIALSPLGLTPGAPAWFVSVEQPLHDITRDTNRLIMAQVWRSCVVVSVALLILWSLAGRIARSITAATRMLRNIAEGAGDLTQRLDVKSSDEVGQLATSFNLFVERIHTIIQHVARASSEVAASSSQISASSQELASGVMQLSNQAAAASSKANDAATVAERGGDIADQAITNMTALNDVITRNASVISELGERGQQIGEIIEIIGSLAQQTNLLALNAAIEAARAGEAGKSFAVVADEVKELANKTAGSTEDILDKLEGIQERSMQATEFISTGLERVTEGREQASAARGGLKEIVTWTKNVTQMIKDISVVSLQLKGGVEQSANGAEHLNRKAEDLRQLVANFKLRPDDAAPVTAREQVVR